MRNVINAILFVTILFVSADSYADPHKDLYGINLSAGIDSTAQVQSDRYTVNYSIFYQTPMYSSSGTYNSSFVNSVIEKASREVFVFLDAKSIVYSDCLPGMNIDIYHISSTTLNDHSRFNEWGPANNVQDRNTFTLWALYDPMQYERYNSSIFITDHGAWANEILLAHEVSHYWYDRMCLALVYSSGTEVFAQQFESFYENKMNRGF